MMPITENKKTMDLWAEGIRDNPLAALLKEVDQLIHKFESTSIDLNFIASEVISLIDKLTLKFDEMIHLPLKREALGQLLKIKVESCQRPVIELLKKSLHATFLGFDVENQQSLENVDLARHVSEAISHSLNSDSKEIFLSLTEVYEIILERLWLLPLLGDRSSYAIIAELHGPNIVEHAHQWLPVISKKYPDKKNQELVLRLFSALERITVCTPHISEEINELQSILQKPAYIQTYLGNIYLKMGEFQTAICCYEYDLGNIKLIQNAECDPSFWRELEEIRYIILNTLGHAHQGLGEVEKALFCFRQSRTIAENFKDLFQEAASLFYIGDLYFSIQKNQLAIEYYEISLSICEKFEDQHIKPKAYENFEIPYEALGEYDLPKNNYQVCQLMPEALKTLNLKTDIYCNLGNAYKNSGNFVKASTYCNLFLQISIELKCEVGKSEAHNNLGTVYELLGEYSNAIHCYEQSLKIARKSKDKPTQCWVYFNLAKAYSALGDYSKALELNNKSLKLISFITDLKTKTELYGNIGNLLASLGKSID